MLRKNELVSEVKKVLWESFDSYFQRNLNVTQEQLANRIVDRVLALIQQEPDANKR